MKLRYAIAVLSLSAAGLVGIVSNENYTDRAIIPAPGDVPTNGFGSTTRDDGSPLQLGDRTTPPKALAKAMRDLATYEGAMKRCVKVPLSQDEYDIYADLTYNIGASAFCGSTLVANLNAGDYHGACSQILRWRYFNGRDCSLQENKTICGGLWVRRSTAATRCLDAQK